MTRPKKFPTILLCFTLVLAILVSGITKPGFLLPLFTPKIPEAVTDVSPLPEDKPGWNGSSRAFRLEPEPALTLYAEENALDTDRTFNVSRMTDAELENIENIVYTSGEPDLNISPLFGWNIDAGMGPEDIMPGVFHIDIDLEKLGIPEDMFAALKAYHIDENGLWREYVSETDGNIFRVESRQNEMMILGISIYYYLLVGGGIKAINEFQTGNFNLWAMDEWYVYENEGEINRRTNADGETVIYMSKTGRKLYTLRCFGSDGIKSKKSKINNLQYQAEREASQEADKLCKQRYGDNYAADPDKKAQYRIEKEKLAADKLKKSQEYQDIVNGLYLDLTNLKFTPSNCVKMSKILRTAHYYLKDVAKLKMPTYVPEIFMKPTATEPGVTVTTYPLGRAYCVIKTADEGGTIGLDEGNTTVDESILLTVTHELTHVCQREYCTQTFANLIFDEASAQLMEDVSLKYYTYKGIIKNTHNLTNGTAWQYFALEMDGFETTTWETSKSTAPTKRSFAGILGFNSKKSDSSYVYARFIEYLWRTVGTPVGEGTGITWDQFFRTYSRFWGAPSFSEMMIKAFDLTGEGSLDTHYVLFAYKNRDAIFASAKTNKDQTDKDNNNLDFRWAYPTVGRSDKNGGETKLVNQDRTIKVRLFTPYVPENYTKKIALVLEQDTGLKAATTDVKFIPMGLATAENCRHGVFYPPDTIERMNNTGIIEVDGKMVEKNSDAELCGYKLWTLFAPDKVTPEKKDQQIRIKMPEKSEAAKADLIDGYRVTITPSRGGSKKEFFWGIGIAGKYVSVNYSDVLDQDFMKIIRSGEEDESEVNFTVSICEYIEDTDLKKHFGPESEEDDLNALLKEMGAHDGRVTITLHWHGTDDLDLHCITPKGGHIYYSNKNADGGYLDVDMNVHGESTNSIEHIYFDTPERGEYTVYIDNFKDRTEGDVSADLIVTVEQQELMRKTVSMGGSSPRWKFKIEAAPTLREGIEYYVGSIVETPDGDRLAG